MSSVATPRSSGPEETGPNNSAASVDPVSGSSATAATGITSEIMAVIEAAATAFVGKKVFILSVKVQSQFSEDANFWASQGRDILQASHNLVQRGH